MPRMSPARSLSDVRPPTATLKISDAGSLDLVTAASRLAWTTLPTWQKSRVVSPSPLMTMAVPVVIFFLAQRFYMQGVVATGVEK